jgi:hypothetical protein
MENLNTKIDGNKCTQKWKLTETKKEELVDALKQELEEKMSAWDIDAFGEYVMKYCTKDEDLKLQINLPAKWEFKWFNFECNIRDLRLFLNEENPSEDKNLGNKIAKLLYSINDYIKAYWIEMDEYEVQNRILNPILKKYHIHNN